METQSPPLHPTDSTGSTTFAPPTPRETSPEGRRRSDSWGQEFGEVKGWVVLMYTPGNGMGRRGCTFPLLGAASKLVLLEGELEGVV